MFATKAFWQLDVHQDAPTLPYGYQTMAFIALTPPLWRHTHEAAARGLGQALRERSRARGGA
jgi:hypothetical protein